jgi:omega-6 fatty acid desaturase (delta-12 desaturase)
VTHVDAASGQRILTDLNRFARPSHARSWLQVLAQPVLLGLTFAAIRALSPSPARFLLILPLAGLLVRTFVLQHDCGHHSLFRGRRLNDLTGAGLSFITGIPYEPWRTEHAWHHTHQAQLDARGIDRVNSPMTSEEASQRPEEASQRHRLIRSWSVFFLGIFSLIFKRKRLVGFFHRRPGFRWRIADPGAQLPSFRLTVAGHVLALLGLIVALGPFDWATVFLPAYFFGAGCGALLFWVQHNFERTYHARDGEWTYLATGLRGSSYVALPPVLRWFTASIGVHHVHHLHPRIPNYRLEEARRAIPEIAAVPAIDGEAFERCFTHIFWDAGRDRMVRLDELGD